MCNYIEKKGFIIRIEREIYEKIIYKGKPEMRTSRLR